MDIYQKITTKIIQEQEGIIGPIALEQAQKVPGLTLHWEKHEVELSGDEKAVVDKLIEQYRHLFGPASVEVCREATRDLVKSIPEKDLPKLLT